MICSQQTSCHEQQFGRPSACGATKDAANSVVGPRVDVGDIPLLARTGATHPRGKFDATLSKLDIHEETAALLRIKAARMGLPWAEFHRLLLECAAYGTSNVASMHIDRIKQVGSLLGEIPPSEGNE